MTNQELYQALSAKGRRGAKKKVREKVGVSVNMLTRVLKHGYPSAHEARIIEAAQEVIGEYEAQEAELALKRFFAAKKRYMAAQEVVKHLAVA